MPNGNQAQNDAEFMQGLNRLTSMNTVDESLDSYLRYLSGERRTDKDGNSIGPLDYISTLESIISPVPFALTNAQPQAIQLEAENHQEAFKGDVERATVTYGDRVISEYSSFINRNIREAQNRFRTELEQAITQVPEGERVKAREQETNNFEAQIHQEIGTAAADFVLKQDYQGNQDLIEAANFVRKLKRSSAAQRGNIAADLTTKKHRLSLNYKNLVKDWDKEANGLEAMYARVIGKALVTQTPEGAYILNEALLRQAYGNVESIKKMSPQARVNYIQSQAQAH